MPIVCTREEKGFTLTEVMVSMAIFLVASMGLLPLLHTNLQANRANRLHTQARRLAGEVMAELQVVDYASLAVVSGESLLAGEIEVMQRVESNLPMADQSRITVTARWQLRDRIYSYQLQSIRSGP
jgi:prepilin-type N-terminal cleavage/methylation domain-containing protein